MKDILLLSIATMFALLYFAENHKRHETEEKISSILEDLGGIARWCDWYFPAVSHTCDYLITVLEGRVVHFNDQFRDKLFEMYGKRDQDEKWELVKKAQKSGA